MANGGNTRRSYFDLLRSIGDARRKTADAAAAFRRWVKGLTDKDANRFGKAHSKASELRKRQANFNTYAREKSQNLVTNVTEAHIGKMLLFWYDAKFQNTLRYWDRLPLVIPFRVEKDRFHGLNFHYLSPKLRAALLDDLFDAKSTGIKKGYNEKKRAQLTWAKIQSAAKSPYYKATVHTYLKNGGAFNGLHYGGVRSKVMVIPEEDLELTLFLPFERFASKTGGPTDPKVIYRESIRRARGY